MGEDKHGRAEMTARRLGAPTASSPANRGGSGTYLSGHPCQKRCLKSPSTERVAHAHVAGATTPASRLPFPAAAAFPADVPEVKKPETLRTPVVRSSEETLLVSPWPKRPRGGAILALALSSWACSQSKEIPVNPWFQIRAKQPVVKGIISFGPGPTQSYRMRSRWGWREVAHGSFGCVMRLHRDTAVLFSPSQSDPLRILYEGEPDNRLIPELLGCEGRLSVPADGAFVDCDPCVSGKSAVSCAEMGFNRYDVAGRSVSAANLPEAPPGTAYLPPGVFAYDARDTPYFMSRAPVGDLHGTACHLLALSPSGLRSWNAQPVSKWDAPMRRPGQRRRDRRFANRNPLWVSSALHPTPSLRERRESAGRNLKPAGRRRRQLVGAIDRGRIRRALAVPLFDESDDPRLGLRVHGLHAGGHRGLVRAHAPRAQAAVVSSDGPRRRARAFLLEGPEQEEERHPHADEAHAQGRLPEVRDE
jgi:hypothetical protein